MELDKLCRLCLSTWDLQCSIYLDMLKPDSLYNSILKSVDIKIENHYGWPYLICRSCWTIVKAMNSFRNMVTSSDIRLRAYLKKFEPDLYPAEEWDFHPPPLASTVILPKSDFAKLCSFISKSTNNSCDKCEAFGTNLQINCSYDSHMDTVEERDKTGSASARSTGNKNMEATIDGAIATPRTKVEILQSENKKLLIIFDKHEDIVTILPPLVASNPLLFEPNSLVRTREVFNQLICRGINPFDTRETERLKASIEHQRLAEESYELHNERAVSSLTSHRITPSSENVSNELSDTDPASSEQTDNNSITPAIQVHKDLSNMEEGVTAASKDQQISTRSISNVKCELRSAQNKGIAKEESFNCAKVRIKEELDLNDATDANEYFKATDIDELSEDNSVEFEEEGSPLTCVTDENEESSVDYSNAYKSRIQCKQSSTQNDKSIKIDESESSKVKDTNEIGESQSTSSGTFKKVRLWNKNLEMSIKKESNILLNYLQFRASCGKFYLCIHCKKKYHAVKTLHEHLRSLYRVGAFCPIGECTYVMLEEVEYLKHVGIHYKTAIVPDSSKTSETKTTADSCSALNRRERVTEFAKKNLIKEMCSGTTKFKQVVGPKQKTIVLKGREIHQSPPRKKLKTYGSEENSGENYVRAMSRGSVINPHEQPEQFQHSSRYVSPLPNKNCKSVRNVATNIAYNTRAKNNKSITGITKNDSPMDQVVQYSNANSVDLIDPSCGNLAEVVDTKKFITNDGKTEYEKIISIEPGRDQENQEC